MVDNLAKTFKTNTTLSNITIEKTDTNNDVGQFTELSHFLRGGQRHKGSESSSGQDRLKGSSDFSFDSVWNSVCKLDLGVVADDVLLVLIKQVVEDLLVKECDSLEVVTASGLEANDFID